MPQSVVRVRAPGNVNVAVVGERFCIQLLGRGAARVDSYSRQVHVKDGPKLRSLLFGERLTATIVYVYWVLRCPPFGLALDRFGGPTLNERIIEGVFREGFAKGVFGEGVIPAASGFSMLRSPKGLNRLFSLKSVHLALPLLFATCPSTPATNPLSPHAALA